MPARLVLIVVLVAGIVLLLRWLARTPPANIARVLKRAAIIGAIALVVLLTVTGRLPWLFAVLGAAAMVIQRLLTAWQLGSAVRRILGMSRGPIPGAGPSAGRSSTIETRFLRMSLDHDTGTMGGTVLEGRYRGRNLDELDLSQLLELLYECRTGDPQSAAVLEAYLDRNRGDDWRQEESAAGEQAGAAPHPGGDMTTEEAYQILGLEPGASEEEIRDTHRRLMQKLHPDRGGSTYLAAKINQAKKMLLGK